ncbi:hypothetical protein GJV26_03300 [Massilia dura]|uniref:Uncharacterized protein n=1 Tax=Pseudoduganella dura TaxID=321982 RepID=A0A6I3X3V1_9BURK|nr:hypothetical protein [Pseudoduganella dura]
MLFGGICSMTNRSLIPRLAPDTLIDINPTYRQPMNRRFALLAVTVSILSACGPVATVPTPLVQGQFTPAAITGTMRQVADWQINSWSTNGFAKPKYNWTYCAAYTGIFQAGLATGDGKYHDFLRKVSDDLQWRTGTRRYFADDYCVGQVFSQLYAQDRQPKMIGPWRALADEIVNKPNNESLSLATRDIMEREWAWCDALFMGPTSLAYLSKATGERTYLDTALKLWWKTSDFLYSPEERLYFRDESYFDKREKKRQEGVLVAREWLGHGGHGSGTVQHAIGPSRPRAAPCAVPRHGSPDRQPADGGRHVACFAA